MRMRKDALRKLIRLLVSNGGLPSKPKGVTLEELLAIFLLIVGQGCTYTVVEERFQRSDETISNHFHMVLNVISRIGAEIVHPRDPSFIEEPHQLMTDENVWPYFKGCIGALDGTHIALHIPDSDRVKWYNRKGVTTTNVLAVCDFDMNIIFASVGMEGFMHETRVLDESMRDRRRCFSHPPPGKFYLADAAYSLQPGFLTPYRKTRYHLKEYGRNRRFRDRSDLFNYRHSTMRNVIERTFGVLKKRWRVLTNMSMVDLTSQIKIIWACIALHNFIRCFDAADLQLLEETFVIEKYLQSPNNDNVDEECGSTFRATDSRTMERFRDSIRDALPMRQPTFN